MSKNSFLIRAGKAYERYRAKEEIWRSLEAIMTLSTVILLSLFAIAPTVRAITDLLAEIKNKEELSVKMKNKINQLISAQVAYADLQGKLFLLDQYLPQQPQLASGVAQLVGITRQSGLVLEQVSLGQFDFAVLPPADSLGSIRFSLRARGGYPEVKSFLSSFYQIRRSVRVNAYQVEKDKEAADRLVLQISGELLFYPLPAKNSIEKTK